LLTNSTLTSIIWDENSTGLLGFINIQNALKTNQTLRNMPLPISDVSQAMKNEDAKQIHKVLESIEQSTLRNQNTQFLGANQ
jgi:hypothetical protein